MERWSVGGREVLRAMTSVAPETADLSEGHEWCPWGLAPSSWFIHGPSDSKASSWISVETGLRE